MSVVSGKALWSIICGQNVLASEEVVGEELQLAAEHLKEGISFYRQFSESDHTEWSSKTKLKKKKTEFVCKLAKLLDVCSEQTWEIFQLFLQHEYKGSISHLSTISTSDREETKLLNQVLSFFLSDQLHLLSCRRHLLFNHETHAYKKLFTDYLNLLLDPKKTLGSEVICQLQKLTSSKIQNDSSFLPPKAMQELIAHRLVAIKHHLATLIIYYGVPTRKCPPQSVIQLLQLAQTGGLGCELLENFDNIERASFSGHIEAINAFHSILLTLVISPDEDPQKHRLCSPEHVKQIDYLVKTLGSKVWHLPPLLSWVIIQGKKAILEFGISSNEAQRYSTLAQRAMKPALFQYLHSILSNSSIKMDFILQSVSVFVSYSLISVLGSCFDLEKLNFTAEVSSMAQLCLASPLTSQFFWEDEAGAASVFLPPALEAFPHNPHHLLRLCSALASASVFSCDRVVQLMCELETFTWPMKETDVLTIGISSSHCVARENILILPGLYIPAGTQGSLIETGQGLPHICWQLPNNGWQVLLTTFNLLHSQIEHGSFADEWLVETVVEGLKLLSSILRMDSKQLTSLVHLHEASRRLFITVARILKPSYHLTAALLEFFAAVAMCSSQSVLNDLDGSPLLPVLPVNYLKKNDTMAILMGYRAGKIRSFICGEEVSSGAYPVLKSLCSMLESTIKMGVAHSHVYGTLIFIVREVLPSILQWTFTNPFEKVSVIYSCFSLLHQSLEAETIGESVKLLVVSELVGPSSGSGRILRAVLEGGILADRLLDQPMEWPLSEYCTKCNKVSQLALSLTHRLVGRYLKLDVNNQAQLTDILGGSNKRDYRGNPRASPHIGLTVARYVHHRLNPRLTYLSLRTLTHFAKELKVPLVACFSTEAEGLRDCLLIRLGSATEDIKVKGALLKFLTTSCKHQPGIIRLFLTPPETLLQTVVSLITSHSKVETEASSELLSSLIEMIAALWEGNYTAATSYLREKEKFWNALSYRLMECKPGTETDEVIGHVIRIFSLENFLSEDKSGQGLQKVLKQFLDPETDVFSKWCEYILVTCTSSLLSDDCENSAQTIHLLQNFRDFVIVLLKKSGALLHKDQKAFLGLKGIQGLNLILESDSDKYSFLNVLLAEIHLHIIHRSSKEVIAASDYKSAISCLLSNLKNALMQTNARCQLPIFASVLKILLDTERSSVLKEISGDLVEYALLLCEQHCALMKYFAGKNDTKYSSPGVLALSCGLLHQCLTYAPDDRIKVLLEQSHIGHALLQAVTSHTEAGNTDVAQVILRLISMLVRIMPMSFDLTCHNIAESISLVLSSQTEEVRDAVLPDLLWCVISCLKREGPSALNDTIDVISLHLTEMTSSFEKPHLKPGLALASASMCDTLAIHQSLWRVLHPHSFQQLICSTAAGIHKTTKLIMLKETVDREAFGVVSPPPSEEQSSETEAQSVNLMNNLIKILGTCLHALHPVSPDVEEILCRGFEVGCTESLIQPTCRRLSIDVPMTLPNLATLADILYLSNIFLPKDVRSSSPVKGATLNTEPHGIDLQALTQCSENALYLLLSHSALILTNSDLPRRDAREVKTFLVDETERFFTQCLGKRTFSSSPLPAAPGVFMPNVAYIKLCSQLVTSICQVSVS